MAFFEATSLGRGGMHADPFSQSQQAPAPPPGFGQHASSPSVNSLHGRLVHRPHSENSPPSADFLSLVTQQASTTPSTVTAPAAPMGPLAEPPSVDFQAQLQEFRESDRRRDDLVSRLYRNYQELSAAYQQKCVDYEQERRSLNMWQRERDRLASELDELKLANESNPLVFVIIDGDGAIFRDDLLSRGTDGGTDAAFELLTQIREHVKSIYPGVKVEDWNIMVQIVISLEGQARTLHAAGIVQDGYRDLNAFAHAFGQAQSLFSFVDVGLGKERADHKIRETMRVMVRLPQCKLVLFGPCADNGYLPFLEPYKREFGHKLSLLETTPPLPGFIQLGLRRAKFPSVFRSESIVRPSFGGSMGNSVPLMRNGSIPQNAANSTHMPPPPYQQQQQSQLSMASPKPKMAETNGGAALNGHQPPPKTASAPPQPAPAAAPANSSYATASTKPPAAIVSRSFDITPKKPAPAPKHYYVNASSERVDEDLPRVAPIAEKRYMEKKKENGRNFCNNYHLLGYCEDEDYCKYEHGDRLSPQELLVQKLRARGTYCDNGIGCDDFDCYYSHHCRYGRDCGMGHKCKFNDTHHMDLRKVAKIYSDGTKDLLS
ncbi:hypothetical protein RB601_009118 [Gaeumannomyces tritici]